MKERVSTFLKDNIVTMVFVVMCVAGFLISGQTFSFIFSEVLTRLFRNLGLVMSLVIPVIAGIGLNFGIVLGAIAAQAAVIFVTHWQLQGVTAIAVMALIATPLSILFGFLLGSLFNRTKGQEMITGMIVGFFANGVYQLFFLVLVGSLIPMVDERIMIYTGVGIKDTIRLDDSVAGALDRIIRIRLDKCYIFLFAILAVWLIVCIWRCMKERPSDQRQKMTGYILSGIALAALFLGFTFQKDMKAALKFSFVLGVPLILDILIGLLVTMILKTKLGQDFRAIGLNRNVAAAAGIDVDRTRIIAIILSTIIASWGQLIFLQNIGNFATYSAHDKVSLYTVAAILVGGASVQKANIRQCILGIILFHTLFVVAPLAGKKLLGDPAYGEYFRECVSYAVIMLSLVLHVSGRSAKKNKK